ncbi:MAG TPA: CBS domain-containing protein [Euryarchaeota archaeon]|nr:putative cystathionine beta-synthase [archaeon BMS3Bbin15]HDL14714.1 CBS domain-containing protein [Euryarchaeota archaeon]
MFNLPTPDELKKHRKMLGLTQAELARKAGVSQPLIARIEAGDIDPRLSTISKIVDVLKRKEVIVNLPVKEIMKSPVLFISPESTLKEASKLMEKYGISQLPVVSEGRQLGSISEELVVNEISFTKPEKIAEKKVKDVMKSGFPTVGKDADISMISKLMESSSVVLVMEMGKIIGIITRADLMKLM